jgi:hypothetical protein
MRSLLLLATGVIMFAGPRPVLNKESADAQFLVLVDLVINYNRKLVLLEQFVEMFPRSPAAPWALGELSSCYRQDGNVEKMVLFASRAIEADPSDLETAHLTWKALANKPGAEKWSAITLRIARNIGAAPAPPGEPSDAWKERAALAAQILATAGPGDLETILAISDPKQRMERLEEEFKRPPPEADRPKILKALFATSREAGDMTKALEYGEVLIKDNLGTEEPLLLVASEYFRLNRESSLTLDYAKRALALVQSNSVTSATPANVPASADLSKLPQTTASLPARANFLIGGALSRLEKYGESDQALRMSLSLVGDDTELKGRVLMTLGSVNVKLGKIDEAIRFYQSCTTLETPFRDEARKTIASIKSDKPSVQ